MYTMARSHIIIKQIDSCKVTLSHRLFILLFKKLSNVYQRFAARYCLADYFEDVIYLIAKLASKLTYQYKLSMSLDNFSVV